MNFGPCQIITENGSGLIEGLQVQIAQDCSHVHLYSEYIENASDATFTLTLEVWNAVDKSLIETIQFGEADIEPAGPFGFKFYDLPLTIDDGLLSLQFTIRYIDGSDTVVYQSACLFVDCATRCALPLQDFEVVMLHYSLTRITGCNCADCYELADAYSAFKSKLTTAGGYEAGKDCGC